MKEIKLPHVPKTIVDKCDACGYKTKLTIRDERRGYVLIRHYLCPVCAATPSGTMLFGPPSTGNERLICKQIAYCTNLILEKLNGT